MPEASLPRLSTERNDWRPAVASALLALTIYAITLGGTYVYDDRYIILTDPRISDTSLWKEFWTKDYFNGGADNLYRPIVSMSYAIQAKLHGTGEKSAWAFHLVNWLLHAAASALVAELARRLTRSTAAGVFAGFLFAAHPIHVEAVANIVGRAELMCAVGILAALVLFLRALTPWRAVAIWICLVFAILSKEQGLLLPLLLVAAIPLRPAGATPASPFSGEGDAGVAPTTLSYASPRTPRRLIGGPALLLLLLTLWTLAAYIFFRERILKFWWDRAFLDPTINPMIESAGVDRWLLPFALLGRYVALLIAPIRLLPDYGGEVIGSHVHFNDPYFYLGATALIAWITACLFAVKRRNYPILFCLLAMALLYGMVANLLTLIGTNFAERLMYIPSAFLCILAAIVLLKLPRRVGVTIATCIILLFSVRTVTYAARWSQPVALFERALEQEPRSIRLYMLLAEECERRGQLDRARAVMAQARDVLPGYYRIWILSARIELDARDFAAARQFAQHARQLKVTPASVQMLQTISEAEAASASTRPATTLP